MTVRLPIETVKQLLDLANALPESTLAREAPVIFADWFKEPGLVMDEATRKLIQETLTRWGVKV